MEKKLVINTIMIFLITSVLSIYSAQSLIQDQIKATLINENPEAIENSIGIILWIIIFTGILLLAFKKLPDYITYIALKVIESIAIIAATTIILYPTNISFEIAIMIGAIIVITKNIYKNSLIKNFVSVIAVAGTSAIIGVSIGTIPALTLMIILAIYDYIAVFKTKHMVEMAKKLSGKNLAFTYEIQGNERKYELGTGDIVIPIVFAISVMHEAMLKNYANPTYLAGIILISSIIGLIITFEILTKQKKPLPALPIQVVCMIIVYLMIKTTELP
ncbi:MAG: presenilin family intramembrane aspartyl protease [Candidatus Diapherotrites archaeon]